MFLPNQNGTTCVTAEMMQSLAHDTAFLMYTTSLQLRNCGLTSTTFTMLMRLVPHMPLLTSIDASDNPGIKEIVWEMSHAKPLGQLVYLNLKNCALKESTLLELARIIHRGKESTVLRHLILGGNRSLMDGSIGEWRLLRSMCLPSKQNSGVSPTSSSLSLRVLELHSEHLVPKMRQYITVCVENSTSCCQIILPHFNKALQPRLERARIRARVRAARIDKVGEYSNTISSVCDDMFDEMMTLLNNTGVN